MRVRFGDCELDTESHDLTRAGQRLVITPKAFRLLAILLENRPRALTKAELHDRVWPETFVGRTSLARLIHEIRTAIGDGDSRPGFLRTVPGVGYAFSGDAIEVGSTSVPEGPAAASPRGQLSIRIVIAQPRPLWLSRRLQGARITTRILLPDGEEIEIGPAIVDVLAQAARLTSLGDAEREAS